MPWIRFQAVPFDGPQEHWELYDISNDFSQSLDLADEMPEKLAELRALFDSEARRHNVYPLRDAGSPRGGPLRVPRLLDGVRKATYTTAHVRMPERSVIDVKNKSFDLTADLVVPDDGCEGVVVCQGGNLAGWTLYLRDGCPAYHYNWFGHERFEVRAEDPLAPGARQLRVLYDHDGGLGAGGTATLFIDGQVVATGRVESTVPFTFSMSGETFDVGVDTGSPVGPIHISSHAPPRSKRHDRASRRARRADPRRRA